MRISEDFLSSSYKKRVLTYFEISQDSMKFNYISRNCHSVKFKVIYAGFLKYFKMSQVTLCEIESHAFVLSPIITPESTTQSCRLFV